jgi:hypothetical protein
MKKSVAISLLIAVILLPTFVLSFFSFAFRAEDWEEVAFARHLNFLVIGPLWATIVFLMRWARNVHWRKVTVATVLLAWLLPASCLSAWTALVLKARLGPDASTSDAEQYRYLVQAICDYRAESGILPQKLDDLVPNYLKQVPNDKGIRWINGCLQVHRTAILYSFNLNDGLGGWAKGILLPNVLPTRPALGGNAQIQARLMEYDRLIAKAPTDQRHHRRKIDYLIAEGTKAEALIACKAAAQSLPQWWRPQMALAVLAAPDGRVQAEKQFHAWVDQHPTFTHYWYLSRFYRDLGRDDDAILALRQGAEFPLQDEDDADVFPTDFTLDAARYAYPHRQHDLVLDITRVWSAFRPQVSGHDFHALRAAAELALGRLAEAKADVDFIAEKIRTEKMPVENFDELQQAVAAGDRSFVYHYGTSGTQMSLDHWKLFSHSEGGR